MSHQLASDDVGSERGGRELALYVALDRGQAGQARGVRGRVGGFGAKPKPPENTCNSV